MEPSAAGVVGRGPVSDDERSGPELDVHRFDALYECLRSALRSQFSTRFWSASAADVSKYLEAERFRQRDIAIETVEFHIVKEIPVRTRGSS